MPRPAPPPGVTHSPTLTARGTAAGVILGTAAYMSPEQARGKPRRQAHGRLGVRVRALRDADGEESVRGGDRHGRPRGHSHEGARTGQRLPEQTPAGVREFSEGVCSVTRRSAAPRHRRRAAGPRRACAAAERLRPTTLRRKRSGSKPHCWSKCCVDVCEREQKVSLSSPGRLRPRSRPRRGRSRCALAPRRRRRLASHGGARPARGLELRSARRAPRTLSGRDTARVRRLGREKEPAVRPVARDGRLDVPSRHGDGPEPVLVGRRADGRLHGPDDRPRRGSGHGRRGRFPRPERARTRRHVRPGRDDPLFAGAPQRDLQRDPGQDRSRGRDETRRRRGASRRTSGLSSCRTASIFSTSCRGSTRRRAGTRPSSVSRRSARTRARSSSRRRRGRSTCRATSSTRGTAPSWTSRSTRSGSRPPGTPSSSCRASSTLRTAGRGSSRRPPAASSSTRPAARSATRGSGCTTARERSSEPLPRPGTTGRRASRPTGSWWPRKSSTARAATATSGRSTPRARTRRSGGRSIRARTGRRSSRRTASDLAWGAYRKGTWAIYEKSLAGGEEERLIARSAPPGSAPRRRWGRSRAWARSSSPPGLPTGSSSRSTAPPRTARTTCGSLSVADGTVREILKTPAAERDTVFSPDGRWIAYMSGESGRPEVYVRAFPTGGGRWQVSTAGGSGPRWSRDGRELFYLAAGGSLMAVPVTAGASFEKGTPRELFRVARPADEHPPVRRLSRRPDVRPERGRDGEGLDAADARPELDGDREDEMRSVLLALVAVARDAGGRRRPADPFPRFLDAGARSRSR